MMTPLPELSTFNASLPIIFMGIMGLSMLAYVVLDGYDLGVGILLRRADADQKDLMIGSIGPFWDANETWLVLGVGILLVAFPMAHGAILTALYLPVALMLLGLILRGVAFDFRAKAHADHKETWNRVFYAGSLLAALSQGYMLGAYITGFEHSWAATGFALLIAPCVAAGYTLLGATWLVMKTEGDLQKRAAFWARRALWLTAVGVLLVSLATPFVSERIFAKWFSLPYVVLLAPIPLTTAVLFVLTDRILRALPLPGDKLNWVPFAATVAIFVLAFFGLAYSLFPYLVIDKIDIWQAASAPESLKIILAGAAVVVPVIIGYTIFSYRVFGGKAQPLAYY
ncbi:cytochrome BD ubiquinol oxidase subunit II [beta proteobacterium AAP99]|nr:cytochrome BD ubiquinol oxidase subunit II [beta proteobacterium AAP99]